ncbi:MAG: hypothetical protein HKM06_07000 [Spirochaetales bacterium]|nr:hypothetical protein [Spirochaetales bacterium]
MLKIFLVVLTLVTGFLHAQDTYNDGQRILPLVRQKTTNGAEFVFPQAPRTRGWLTIGPWPTGQIQLRSNPEQGGRPLFFPQVADSPVWIAVPWITGFSTLALASSGLFPDRLRFVFTPRLVPQDLPLLVHDLGSYKIFLPPWQVDPGYLPSLHFRWEGKSPLTLKVEDQLSRRNFRFSVSPRKTTAWDYYPQVWGVRPRVILLKPDLPQDFTLLSLSARGTPVDDPVRTDLETALGWPNRLWAHPDHQWFLWQNRPNILILISENYAVQSDFFKRLAFFVEKKGFRGQILPNRELRGLHGWNAHDYAPEALARFFNLAADQKMPLLPQEVELRGRLVRQGLLLDDGHSRWIAGQGALLGVSLESEPDLRAFLLTHEAFHGLYYTSSAYRSYARKIWNGLSEQAQDAFREFLSLAGYDSSWEELMLNEFQAYSLQQPPSDWHNFFAGKVIARGAAQDSPQQKIILEQEFTAAATLLNQEVQRLFGVSAGNVLDPIAGPRRPLGEK